MVQCTAASQQMLIEELKSTTSHLAAQNTQGLDDRFDFSIQRFVRVGLMLQGENVSSSPSVEKRSSIILER